jgi:ketosteroid isomerase-like protein
LSALAQFLADCLREIERSRNATLCDAFVDRFLEPWNRHDVDGALSLMTDDCVWEVTRGHEPHGTLHTGRAGVRSAIVEAFKALPDVYHRAIRNSFGENLVVVELLVTGTLGDGSKARFHACDILTLRDGLIAAKRSYRKVVE